jgi:hypothetical protein
LCFEQKKKEKKRKKPVEISNKNSFNPVILSPRVLIESARTDLIFPPINPLTFPFQHQVILEKTRISFQLSFPSPKRIKTGLN